MKSEIKFDQMLVTDAKGSFSSSLFSIVIWLKPNVWGQVNMCRTVTMYKDKLATKKKYLPVHLNF